VIPVPAVMGGSAVVRELAARQHVAHVPAVTCGSAVVLELAVRQYVAMGIIFQRRQRP
jgi:hypothetical protein